MLTQLEFQSGDRSGQKLPATPGLDVERVLWGQGALIVAGLDEVGRGAWAGPLVVGVVSLKAETARSLPEGIRDSKQLSPQERERLCPLIRSASHGWAVGSASPAECDRLGMSEAQRLAAGRALDSLEGGYDRAILDGRWDFVGNGRAQTVVGGDDSCLSVAAASVLAKAWRDRLMVEEAAHYPQFDFARNKGYPCPRHRAALAAWGPTAIHRRSWAFMEHLSPASTPPQQSQQSKQNVHPTPSSS